MILYTIGTDKNRIIPHGQQAKVNMYTIIPLVLPPRTHIKGSEKFILAYMLEKYLCFMGYDVKRVKNITDVVHLQEGCGYRLYQNVQRQKREQEDQQGNW